jgi:hypothetical protein
VTGWDAEAVDDNHSYADTGEQRELIEIDTTTRTPDPATTPFGSRVQPRSNSPCMS